MLTRTQGTKAQLEKLTAHIYTKSEINLFNITEGIENNPVRKHYEALRSRLAYRAIIKNSTQSTRYLLPGQLSMFYYHTPKYKDELEYYDRVPLTLFCGITRTKDGNIREVGFNLHYFPPFTRKKIFAQVYNAFKPYWEMQFNRPSRKPNMMVSYNTIKAICKANQKLAFGVRMYIPVLRGATFLIPTRLFSTAFYTEGIFSKATRVQIRRFWREYD